MDANSPRWGVSIVVPLLDLNTGRISLRAVRPSPSMIRVPVKEDTNSLTSSPVSGSRESPEPMVTTSQESPLFRSSFRFSEERVPPGVAFPSIKTTSLAEGATESMTLLVEKR